MIEDEIRDGLLAAAGQMAALNEQTGIIVAAALSFIVMDEEGDEYLFHEWTGGRMNALGLTSHFREHLLDDTGE